LLILNESCYCKPRRVWMSYSCRQRQSTNIFFN